MYVISTPINAMIQEITQRLKVGGFWSTCLNESLTQRYQIIGPHLAPGKCTCRCQRKGQAHERCDVVLSIEDDIVQNTQDNDCEALAHRNQIGDSHPGKVIGGVDKHIGYTAGSNY